MYKHAFLTLAVAMATASAFERATGYYYNTADDSGMDAYGYQMPLVAAPSYYDGHDDAGLVYAPYHNAHRVHKRSPGVLITSKLASLAGLKGLALAKTAGLGAAAVLGKKSLAFKSAYGLKALSAGGAGLAGITFV